MLLNAKVIAKGEKRDVDIIEDFIKLRSPVVQKVEGRIVVKK